MTMDAADAILEAAEKATAVAIGPGIGRTDAVRALIGYLLDRLDKPIVLDADGLWAAAGHLDWIFLRDAPQFSRRTP
jgi:NAD(P)H-hydrate epimerase